VFLNEAKSFINWVNEGDHLRIISMQEGPDVKAVFARLSSGASAIEAGVRALLNLDNNQDVFMMHPLFGSVACCPSNIGTGMRGSVHIMVPKLIAKIGFEAIDKLARARNCQARGSSGEHSEVVDRLDISNWRRIGVPEYELVDDMIQCANYFAAEEDELSKETLSNGDAGVLPTSHSDDLLQGFFKKNKVVICVTDVGLGGLSVVSEIERRFQNSSLFESVSLVYFNSAVSPGYTQRPLQEQTSIFNSALEAMQATFAPDLILIACNTLSVLYPETEFAQRTSMSGGSRSGPADSPLIVPVLNIVDFGVDLLEEKLLHGGGGADQSSSSSSVALLFGTTTTAHVAAHRTALVARGVAPERIVMQACPKLATSIQEHGAAADETNVLLSNCVHDAWEKFVARTEVKQVFVGLCCTHYGYSLPLWQAALAAESEVSARTTGSNDHVTSPTNVATECLNPNSRMAEFIFKQAALRGGAAKHRSTDRQIEVDVQVVSMVDLARSAESIAPLLGKPVGDALRKFEHRAHLFKNPLLER
jgi:glutamate racemase